MSDISKKLNSIEKLAKEAERLAKNLQENPFSAFDRIVKDIQEQKENAMAMEFTKCIGELLKKNGVVPKITEYTHENVRENSIEHRYGASIDGLDFTEHDKKFKDEIKQLKTELFDAQKLADEYYNKCIDLTNQIKKLKSELETKVDFETERLVKLPFDTLETANMLINAKYKAEIPFLERQVDRNVYGIDDLEQIAEHLLVYCKHHREIE